MRFLALIAIFTCISLLSRVTAAEFPEISKADLEAAIAAKTVTIIDVNGTESWSDGHIPSAIDFASAKSDLGKQLPADKQALVVAYCGGPHCGAWARAATAAAELGYINVKHFKDGISGWKNSGGTMETASAK